MCNVYIINSAAMKETRRERDMCTPMFIAALFIKLIFKKDGLKLQNEGVRGSKLWWWRMF